MSVWISPVVFMTCSMTKFIPLHFTNFAWVITKNTRPMHNAPPASLLGVLSRMWAVSRITQTENSVMVKLLFERVVDAIGFDSSLGGYSRSLPKIINYRPTGDACHYCPPSVKTDSVDYHCKLFISYDRYLSERVYCRVPYLSVAGSEDLLLG